MYQRDNLKDLLDEAVYSIDKTDDKNVLVRSCLNVPLNKTGEITDITRIDESLPLLKELKGRAKRIVILAHLGRPEGIDSTLSLEPVKQVLEEELDTSITLIEDLEKGIPDKGFVLIENIRFFEGENTKDLDQQIDFAKKLAQLGDVFINDAFADYRESPSTYHIANLLPSYLGPSFYKEIKAFSEFTKPNRPFVAILGGAKLSEKLDALNSLLEIADKVLIGGAMSYTLLKAMDINIGKSLIEPDKIDVAKEIVRQHKEKLILPLDHILVDEFKEPKSVEEYTILTKQEIPEGKIAVDIGPETVRTYLEEISKAESIIWNGPMGVFEWDLVGNETKVIADAIVSNRSAYTLAGGGDSIAAINKYNIQCFDHVSTGGGAMLAFFSYESFGTLDVILDQYEKSA